MSLHRNFSLSAVALAGALMMTAAPAQAQSDPVFGSWTPPMEYQNRVTMPKVFEVLEKGANQKWKLIAGGQLADGRGIFTGVRDGVMEAGGPAIATYQPNLVPSLYAIYSTNILGHNDVIATTGAALETFYLNCPSCLEEFKKLNGVPLAGWTSSAYMLACREPVKSLADLKGKRVRATGGAAEFMKHLGAVPVGATLAEAVGLLQRGGLDCQYGIHDWLRTFGYADFAKHITDHPLGLTGPAIGMMLSRNVWNKLTPEQKKLYIQQAAWMSANQVIGNFIMANESGLAAIMKDKGVQLVKVDGKEWDAAAASFKAKERETNVETATKFGVKDAGRIIDAYEAAVKKWQGLAKDVGRDEAKLQALYDKEIFSKIDLDKL
jgi:TRAP-type C4-dicarboxylate transport system substrate-binding protein